ncbi:MAG: NUDIX hydrolase [Candidatus Kerfeldbacteria bacterium]|nr:NUDIX hydrolase [Candidatus Kerfeldbacteria bacterium]
MEHRVSVWALIQNAEGNYLFTRRHPGDDFGGCWDIPGGRMQEGEQPIETVLREVREEVSLRLAHGKLLTAVSEQGHHDTWVTFLLYAFQFFGDPNDVHLDDDHTDYRWLTVQEARRECEFASAAKKLIDQLVNEGYV